MYSKILLKYFFIFIGLEVILFFLKYIPVKEYIILWWLLPSTVNLIVLYLFIKETKDVYYWKVVGGLLVLILLPDFINYLYDLVIWLFRDASDLTILGRPIFAPFKILTIDSVNSFLNIYKIDDAPKYLKIAIFVDIIKVIGTYYMFYVIGRMSIHKALGINRIWSFIPVISNYMLIDKLRMYNYFKPVYIFILSLILVFTFIVKSVPILIVVLILLAWYYVQFKIYKELCVYTKIPAYNTFGLLVCPFIYQFQVKYYLEHPERVNNEKESSIYLIFSKYFVVIIFLQSILDLSLEVEKNSIQSLFLFIIGLITIIYTFNQEAVKKSLLQRIGASILLPVAWYILSYIYEIIMY